MDLFFILGFITIVILILSFIAYSTITKKIIKEQETEIASLQTEIKRLRKTKGGMRK